MTDITNQPPPPPPPPQPPQGQPDPEQQESSLREELAKVRSRNKLLVTVSVVLGTIFVLLAGAGYIVYTKINAVKDNLEQAFSSMPMPPAGYQQGGAPGGYGQSSSTAMPSSSLGLFSGGLPGAGPAAANFDPVQAQKAAQAMQKYADRPVVREFMADLKKLPEMNGVLDGSKANNPLAVIAMLQNAKGLNKIIPKYATRPDFIALMMEAMADPDMQPLLKGMPGMGIPSMPQGLPAAARSARGVAVEPAPPDEPEYSEGEMVLDPSAISGPSKTAPARAKKAPPPIDTD